MDPPAQPTAVERILALADQCVLCGLCLPHCPTYALDRIEAESPRGRIMQFRGLADGSMADTAAARTHLDHCLGCRNCEPVCPAGVRYGALLAEGRALQRRQRPPAWRQRALEWLVARPGRFRIAAALGRRLRPLLPRALRRQADALQAPRRWPAVVAAQGARRGRVGLLLGCTSRHVQPAALHAAVQVLTQLGWDVHLPAQQGCCGALALHGGDPDAARQQAAANSGAFAASGVEHLLVLDSGCVESQRLGTPAALPVQELLAFVAGDAQLQRLGRAVGPGRACDALLQVEQGLDALQEGPQGGLLAARRGPVVALHLPCTQRNVSGGADATAALLARLGLPVQVLGAQGCCGAAGTHMVLEPKRAAAFRAPLLQALAQSGAATLATGNVGCRMHLADGLAAAAGCSRVVHPIELIAECLSPAPPAA